MPRKNPQATAEGGAAVAERAAAPTRVPPTSLPARELHTADVREPELSEVKMPPLGQGLPDRGDTQVAIPDAHISKDYLAQLAFMEEPVKIRIEPPAADNPQMTVDCYCNGKGAEILDERTGRWLEFNILPVGLVVTTKRKYVEILARSKTMKVSTPDHSDGRNIDNNNVTRAHARSHVFSIIEDKNPRGAQWFTALINEAF